MSKLAVDNSEYICLARGANGDNTLLDMPTPRPSQMPIVADQLDVIAGHMAWGFDKFVHKTPTYITCLRNPMSRFVSDILYANRFTHKTSEMTLQQTVEFVERHIFGTETGRYRGIYAARLSSRMHEKTPHRSSPEEDSEEMEQEAADLAIFHLENDMAVVGQVEQYPVFVELVAARLDPDRRHEELWANAKVYHSNKHEGYDQSDVIPHLSGEATRKLKEILALDWKVYLAGCEVTYRQCQQVARSKAGDLYDRDCKAVRRTCGF